MKISKKLIKKSIMHVFNLIKDLVTPINRVYHKDDGSIDLGSLGV